MADLKISQLPNASTPLAGTEMLPIVQAGVTDKVTVDNLLARLTAAPPAIGTTTPAAGSFTTLAASGSVTLGDASTDTLNIGNGGIIKDASGNTSFGGSVLLTSVNGLGYGAGAGGTVTQATSKATAVTLNKPTGQITMNNAALAGGASVSFTLTCANISVDDLVLPLVRTPFAANYSARAGDIGSGSALITLTNTTGSSASDSVVVTYAVIKGATS